LIDKSAAHLILLDHSTQSLRNVGFFFLLRKRLLWR